MIIQGWMGAARCDDAGTFFNATVPWNFSLASIEANPDLLADAQRHYALLEIGLVTKQLV